jgi:oligoendopeptidase F
MDAHINGRLRQARLCDPKTTHEYQVFNERYQMPPLAADVLIKTVHNTLPVYKRGGQLQAARLGVETYAPYDAEPALGSEAGRYSYDEAVELILSALAPLGNEYLTVASRILHSNHINIFPKEGKQSGAFCIPAGVGIDPYIHINFDGSLNSVSTLAHELGHAAHFVLSADNRAPALITTETAAITNEILLANYMLREAGDFDELNCAASVYADLIGSTLYNQTRLFAFERAMYNHVKNGETLTADKADKLWHTVSEPFKNNYLSVPEVAQGSWSAVPHLYRDFYVVNYAFSAAAAETFAQKILDGGAAEYIDFLSMGGSKPAYELFLNMGVDFLQKEAYNDIVSRFDELLDIMLQIEAQREREDNAA